MPSDKRVPRVRKIDMSSYGRLQVFSVFRNFDVPVNARTIQFDIGKTLEHVRQRDLVFSLTMTLLVTRAANEIPEFRHRIVDAGVVEHDVIVPLYTHHLVGGALIAVRGTYTGDFGKDYRDNLALRSAVAGGERQPVDYSDQGYIVVSVNPWISFTAYTFPYSRHSASIPMVSIGKYHEQLGQVVMPLALQTNHAVMDGYHVGQFVDALSTYLNEPERHIAPAAG